MLIAVDIDGVICRTDRGRYWEATPKTANIEQVSSLLDGGHVVYFFTARGSSLGSVRRARERWYETTRSQLDTWGFAGCDVLFGKPMYDLLIDDRAVNGDNLAGRSLPRMIAARRASATPFEDVETAQKINAALQSGT